MPHWAPIEWAMPELQAIAKARAPTLGKDLCQVMWARGSDGNAAQYVVDYQNVTGGVVYLRLPPLTQS